MSYLTSSLNFQKSAKFFPKFCEMSISSLNFTDVHQNGHSVQKLCYCWWCVLLHVVLSCTCVNKEATCIRTNLMEMVKIVVLTFQLSFFCVSNYTPILLISSILTFHSETSNTSLTFLLPTKIFIIFTSPKSSSSPARNVAKDSVLT